MRKMVIFIATMAIVTYVQAQESTDTLHLFLPHITTIHETETVYVHVRDTIYTNCAEASGDGDGTLTGEFSVSATTKVHFSQGNLQFNAAQGTHATADGKTLAGTWRFATQQYDIIGRANKNNSETYSGWIDLMFWATSGYDNTTNDPYAVNFQPWSNSTERINDYNYAGYGPSTNMTDDDMVGTSANYDWGVYNAISNGGNQPGRWRTLTKAEWNYLFVERTNAKKLFGLGRVNGVNGTIILPDDWTTPNGLTFVASTMRDLKMNNYDYYSNTSSENYSNNTYTAAEWQKMEAAGAVFLPAAGRNERTNNRWYVNDVNSSGFYWSATRENYWEAYECYFTLNRLSQKSSSGCHYGYSVRLVR